MIICQSHNQLPQSLEFNKTILRFNIGYLHLGVPCLNLRSIWCPSWGGSGAAPVGEPWWPYRMPPASKSCWGKLRRWRQCRRWRSCPRRWDARTDGLISRIQGHFKMRVYLINNNVQHCSTSSESSKELPLTFTIYSEASRRARHARHARRLTLPKTGGLAGAGVRNSYITPLRSTLALGIGVPWGRPTGNWIFWGQKPCIFWGVNNFN